MSMYDDDGGLYSAGSYVGDFPAVAATPAASVPSVEVIQQSGASEVPFYTGNPPVSVLPPESSGPSIPFGLAIVGVLAVAVIWANSLEGSKK